MNTLTAETETPGDYPLVAKTRTHTLRFDMPVSDGGQDTSPGPHDYFDASLAACKALTAMWYAKRHAIPLERVETQLTRDDADERKGVYRLAVQVTFIGPLTDAQRAQLGRAIGGCPIHKLMTTADVQVEVTSR